MIHIRCLTKFDKQEQLDEHELQGSCRGKSKEEREAERDYADGFDSSQQRKLRDRTLGKGANQLEYFKRICRILFPLVEDDSKLPNPGPLRSPFLELYPDADLVAVSPRNEGELALYDERCAQARGECPIFRQRIQRIVNGLQTSPTDGDPVMQILQTVNDCQPKIRKTCLHSWNEGSALAQSSSDDNFFGPVEATTYNGDGMFPSDMPQTVAAFEKSQGLPSALTVAGLGSQDMRPDSPQASAHYAGVSEQAIIGQQQAGDENCSVHANGHTGALDSQGAWFTSGTSAGPSSTFSKGPLSSATEAGTPAGPTSLGKDGTLDPRWGFFKSSGSG